MELKNNRCEEKREKEKDKKLDKEKLSAKTIELIAKASELPMVQVNREEFLRKTFKGDPNIEVILEKGSQAVYTVESLRKKQTL